MKCINFSIEALRDRFLKFVREVGRKVLRENLEVASFRILSSLTDVLVNSVWIYMHAVAI